jgi:pilus assembly protein Flp/PilA
MFSQLARHATDFLRREDGPTAVEYAVMLALVVVVCIGSLVVLGKNANNTYTSAGKSVGS